MAYRWKPNSAQKKAYRERMLEIEASKYIVPDGYNCNCSGDCCTGDEIAFFKAGTNSIRLFGKIITESYGKLKQQHTFTILLDSNEKILIKGRNLYLNVWRKKWDNEEDREIVLKEKHSRGSIAREEKSIRVASCYNL